MNNQYKAINQNISKANFIFEKVNQTNSTSPSPDIDDNDVEDGDPDDADSATTHNFFPFPFLICFLR